MQLIFDALAGLKTVIPAQAGIHTQLAELRRTPVAALRLGEFQNID
jgi:hypothetical protein